MPFPKAIAPTASAEARSPASPNRSNPVAAYPPKVSQAKE
jgi:hypothetical protein